MRIDHHLKPATLHGCLAGTLAEPLALVAASHVSWCPACRRALEAARTCDSSEAASPALLPVGKAGADRDQGKAQAGARDIRSRRARRG
jgi:hypothetical protein